MPLPVTIDQPTREAQLIALKPVRNILASMMLLTKEKEHEMPGVGAWVVQTRAKLTEEELSRHKLVIIGFFHAILPDKEWDSFPDFLAELEHSDPAYLRDKMLSTYAKVCFNCDEEVLSAGVNWDVVLASPQSYVAFLTERFGKDWIEVDMETKAYEYVIDPPAMRKLIVEHLRWFWDTHLAQEWEHAEPLLKESIKAFQHVNFENMSALETARYITGQDLEEEKWSETLQKADRITYIPNPHIGPYVTRLHSGDSIDLIFGARQPEDASVRIPELDRADIVARMSALADDNRLRILQMVAEHGELRSQDIIEEIGLSQPSVSRYLTQLTVTGYLQERRVNGSKAYTLNRDRIEKTLKAVHKFLLRM